VEPISHAHSVTVTTVSIASHLVRVEIVEHPHTVVLQELAKVQFDRAERGPCFIALNRLLDRYGYVIDGGSCAPHRPRRAVRLGAAGPAVHDDLVGRLDGSRLTAVVRAVTAARRCAA
jgi:hypothetical protein